MTWASYCRQFKPAIEGMAAAVLWLITLISMLVAWDKVIPPDETEQELFGDDWDGDTFSPAGPA